MELGGPSADNRQVTKRGAPFRATGMFFCSRVPHLCANQRPRFIPRTVSPRGHHRGSSDVPSIQRPTRTCAANKNWSLYAMPLKKMATESSNNVKVQGKTAQMPPFSSPENFLRKVRVCRCKEKSAEHPLQPVCPAKKGLSPPPPSPWLLLSGRPISHDKATFFLLPPSLNGGGLLGSVPPFHLCPLFGLCDSWMLPHQLSGFPPRAMIYESHRGGGGGTNKAGGGGGGGRRTTKGNQVSLLEGQISSTSPSLPSCGRLIFLKPLFQASLPPSLLF